MQKVRSAGRFLFGSGLGRVALVTGAVGVALASTAGQAFATCSGSYCGNGGDTVDVGFGTLAGNILGYLADGVALVIAVIGIGLGIRMLIKWARRGVSAT